MAIKIFTLNNGDDIIGDMLDEDTDVIIVKDPLIIKYAFSTRGGMYMQLKYYGMFSSDSLFSFKKSAIISVCIPRDNMVDYYILSAEIAKNEFVEDINDMIADQIAAIENYNANKQVELQTESAFSDFLEKVTIKTMQ